VTGVAAAVGVAIWESPVILCSLQNKRMAALTVRLLVGASWDETAWHLGIPAGHDIPNTGIFWIKAGG